MKKPKCSKCRNILKWDKDNKCYVTKDKLIGEHLIVGNKIYYYCPCGEPIHVYRNIRGKKEVSFLPKHLQNVEWTLSSNLLIK